MEIVNKLVLPAVHISPINNRPRSINEVQEIRTPLPNTFVSARSSSSSPPARALRGLGSANQIRAGA